MSDESRIGRARYQSLAVSRSVRYYGPEGGLRRGVEQRLSDEEYARARAVLPVFCLDGLVCARDEHAEPIVVLAERADAGESSGPFRGEPWVVGGRWDLSTPWEEFVARRAELELFGGESTAFAVDGPIGDQLFATSWPEGGDGPFARQGLTVQLCFQLRLLSAWSPDVVQPDRCHSAVRLLRWGDRLDSLHPYVRDVVTMSGWLAGEEGERKA